MVDGTYIDFSQGDMERTDNELDLAIEGSGFFAIETESGTRYTRSGNFEVSGQGILTDPDGHAVLSDSGPIPAGGGEGVVAVTAEHIPHGAVGKLKIADLTSHTY
jgi:flagellar hook-basal body protein